MGKITALLLNKLATSPVREVKQFAIERSRAISQMLAQQQQSAVGRGEDLGAVQGSTHELVSPFM